MKRLLFLVAAFATPVTAQQPRANLILVNGKVLTVDAADRVAQAVAIAGDRIVAVGTNAEIERVAAAIAAKVKTGEHGEWIQGRGWTRASSPSVA